MSKFDGAALAHRERVLPAARCRSSAARRSASRSYQAFTSARNSCASLAADAKTLTR
jgi:hypothetical protein